MISSLKDLRAVLKLCRSLGVSEFKIGDVAIKLGEPPQRAPRGKAKLEAVKEEDFEMPDDEQMAMFSVRQFGGG